MTRDELIAWCRTRGACGEARRWLGLLPESATLADAWSACDRGDWLLWLATATDLDRRRVVEIACDCAETALAHVPPSEKRPARAIAAARAWARGEATSDDVRAAADDARAAARAAARADDAAAARASDAAADAAYAAYAASSDVPAFAADAAAEAADAAAVAFAAYASDAVACAAYAAALAQHAALVRGRISAADVEAAMEAAR